MTTIIKSHNLNEDIEVYANRGGTMTKIATILANGGVSAPANIRAADATNVVLTAADNRKQIFLNPTNGINVDLLGDDFKRGEIVEIVNEHASNSINIRATGGAAPETIYSLNRGKIVLIAREDNPNTAAKWRRDYLHTELQSFTPVLKFGTTTQTLTQNYSQWQRTNNNVYVMIAIAFNRSGTGTFKIELPSTFPTAAPNTYSAFSIARFDRFIPTNRLAFFRIDPGTRNITGMIGGGDTYESISDTHITTLHCPFQITGIYIAG